METSSERPAGEGREVLVFYDGYELKAREGLLGAALSFGHHHLRTAFRTLKGVQIYSGYYVAYQSLVASLRRVGCRVRINDFAAARRNPDALIAVAGYLGVFEATDSLPNPRIVGHGFWGRQGDSGIVVDDPRYRRVTFPSDWFADTFAECNAKRAIWFAGIDTDAWPDASGEDKTLDVLVYDKTRWNRAERAADLVGPVQEALTARGLRWKTLRYGEHRHDVFRADVRRARSLVFLCEHETQGLAYQEAMSAGVPVLAWDDHALVDPNHFLHPPPKAQVSSVPFFDARCGERFQFGGFEPAFDAFWAKLDTYEPRAYVIENLSLKASGEAFLKICDEVEAELAAEPPR